MLGLGRIGANSRRTGSGSTATGVWSRKKSLTAITPVTSVSPGSADSTWTTASRTLSARTWGGSQRACPLLGRCVASSFQVLP